MGNKEKNRKDWIKNVLIVFLVIMLLLTFFSNTIMNYSLPEVSSSYISPGYISTSIKGSGTIQGVDPYEVSISEGRRVVSVNVRSGDSVNKGDVLFVLEEGASSEAEDAKKNYNDLLAAYQMYIIDNRISNEIVNAAENNDQTFIQDKRTKLAALTESLKVKEKAVEEIDAKLSILGVTIVDTKAESAKLEAAKTAYDSASKLATEKETAVNEIEAQIVQLQNYFYSLSEEEQAAQSDDVVSKLVILAGNKDKANTELKNAKAEVEKCSKEIESLEKQISDKEKAPSKETEELTYKRALAVNERDALKNEYDSVYNDIKNQMQLVEMLAQIKTAKEQYDKIASKTIGNEVLSPVTGTISSVEVVAGEKVSANTCMAVIQLTGKDYILEMTVSKEQAARIKIGDIGKATNYWYYNDLSFVVTAIKPDMSNPKSGNKIVVFSVTGDDIRVGQSVTLNVGEKQASYDMVVPNTAIREDKNGLYILIITSKSTPLGNRYTATRVDVTKLASDDTNTAISCALQGYESVITTSTKPVAGGDLVRLPK